MMIHYKVPKFEVGEKSMSQMQRIVVLVIVLLCYEQPDIVLSLINQTPMPLDPFGYGVMAFTGVALLRGVDYLEKDLKHVFGER